MMPKNPRSNWTIRAYKNSSLVDSWTISNRTETEALDDAEKDVAKLGSKVDDWTLMPNTKPPFSKIKMPS